MSVQTGRVVSADEARRYIGAVRNGQAATSNTAGVSLAHTVVVQAEQIAAVLALHHPDNYGACAHCSDSVEIPHPCPTARALGVSEESA